MMIFAKKNLVLRIACLAVCGLAFSLTACDSASSEASAIIIAADSNDSSSPESSSSTEEISLPVVSSSSTKSNTFGLKKYKACDKALEGRYVKYAYLYGGTFGPSSSASDGSYIENAPSLDAYKDGFFKCEDDEWVSVDEKEVSTDSDIFFVVTWKDDVCDADHENVIDSVWKPNPSISTPIYFYRRCENGEWIYKDHSVTCNTTGVAVGDTCRRAEVVDFVDRRYGSFVNSKTELRDQIYSYVGDGKWEKFDCNSSLPEACSPTNDDLSYEKVSKETKSYTYSIYCKCMDVVVGYESSSAYVGGKTYLNHIPIHASKWHDVGENIYVPVEDSLAAASSFNPDEVRACDKTLEIDGHVVKHEYTSSHSYYGYSPSDTVSKYLYYKCEDNKWSILQRIILGNDGKILDSASVVSFAELGVKHLYDFKKCNADNEMAVDSLLSPTSKLDIYDFYRCEQGTWVQRSPSVTCDKAGVSVGDTCKRALFAGSPLEEIYIYAGNGIWEESKTVHWAPLTEDCSAENDGSYVTQVDTVVKVGASPAYETSYYHCESKEWKRVDCLAPETACTKDAEGKIDSTKGLLPLESRTQDVNSVTCHFTCKAGKWNRNKD